MRVLILLLMLLLPGLSQAQPGDDLFAPRGATQTDFLPVEKAFRFTWERLDDGQVQLRWQIAPGYYLYQKRLRFDGLDPALQPQLPPGESHSDEFFGESQVYRQSLELPAGGRRRTTAPGLAGLRRCRPVLSAAEPGARPGRYRPCRRRDERRSRRGPGPGRQPAGRQPGLEPVAVLRPRPAAGVRSLFAADAADPRRAGGRQRRRPSSRPAAGR
ncbi:protein-disulfide reductase DsbD family protein [Pseudomonas aeruginosa]|nr:protein-disulfide reductase DsbD family protein [Pseudomonas aeruginosa]